MAKDLAKQIHYTYIDSGAMYRATTLFALKNNLFQNGILEVSRLENQMNEVNISFHLNPITGIPETFLNGENVEQAIRGMDIASKVSEVSALKFVREAMVRQQQLMGREKGIVMDGRDIGTVVFPNAELKIFVTAQPEIRAQRRLQELHAKGNTSITMEEVLDNIKQRDFLDQNRKESPLRKADNAFELDNSNLTKEQQQEILFGLFNKTVNQ